MTQEVQPLAWQKRTNLEEHQQFFSKINEIIANLAPTVNEAEQAIAQATAAIASANDAVSTANAASAAASAAASQAQTAASTVAGYDTRLTAVENADTQNVKLTGDQTITGVKKFDNIIIPTTNGNFNGGAVIRVPNDLGTTDIITSKNDNSASILNLRLIKNDTSTSFMTMVRTPSNQQKYVMFQANDDGTYVLRGPGPYSGAPSDSYITKGYVESTDGVTNNLVHTNANETILSNKTIGDTAHLGYRLDVYGSNTSGSRKINIVGGTDVQSTAPSKDTIYPYMSWSDSNNNVVGGIRAIHNSDGSYSLQAMVLNANGTEKYITIAKGD